MAPNMTRIMVNRGLLVLPPGHRGRKASHLCFEVPLDEAEERLMERSKCFANWYEWWCVLARMDTDPACKDCNGWTAFMHALDAHFSVRAYRAAYDFLTKYDFSPGAGHHNSLFDRTTGSQPNGYTPLHFACPASYRDFNNAEIVHLLLERRSNMALIDVGTQLFCPKLINE